jgi:hypothetical protein
MCDTLAAVTSLFLAALDQDTSLTHALALRLINTHGNIMIQHIGVPSEEFINTYRIVNNVPMTTAPTAILSLPKQTIRASMVSIFSFYIVNYKRQLKGNELNLLLRKKAKEANQLQATEAAALEANAELPVNPQQMQDIIQKEATKITNKQAQSFKKELAELKAILAKNGTRGPTPRGASSKKKNQGGKSARGAVVAAAASGTNSQPGEEDSRNGLNRNRQRQGKKSRKQNSQSNHKADAAKKGSNEGNGGNVRRRSRSRSKNRNDGGAKRNNRSSRA